MPHLQPPVQALEFRKPKALVQGSGGLTRDMGEGMKKVLRSPDEWGPLVSDLYKTPHNGLGRSCRVLLDAPVVSLSPG